MLWAEGRGWGCQPPLGLGLSTMAGVSEGTEQRRHVLWLPLPAAPGRARWGGSRSGPPALAGSALLHGAQGQTGPPRPLPPAAAPVPSLSPRAARARPGALLPSHLGRSRCPRWAVDTSSLDSVPHSSSVSPVCPRALYTALVFPEPSRPLPGGNPASARPAPPRPPRLLSHFAAGTPWLLV